MYSVLIMFALSNLIYFALHVTSGGSFPKPLSQKEERECFEKIKLGDIEAKNKLIEHNLRLVAHIIKLYCYKQQVRKHCATFKSLSEQISLYLLPFHQQHILILVQSPPF